MFRLYRGFVNTATMVCGKKIFYKYEVLDWPKTRRFRPNRDFRKYS